MRLPDSSEKTLHPATLDKVEQLRQVNSDSPIPTRRRAHGPRCARRPRAGRWSRALICQLDALRSLIGDRNGIEPWLLHTRALELEGFMPGDIVLVDLNASPKPGDAVYATVRERIGQTRGRSCANTSRRPGGSAGARAPTIPAAAGALVVDREPGRDSRRAAAAPPPEQG
jgi:hypothetical protein